MKKILVDAEIFINLALKRNSDSFQLREGIFHQIESHKSSLFITEVGFDLVYSTVAAFRDAKSANHVAQVIKSDTQILPIDKSISHLLSDLNNIDIMTSINVACLLQEKVDLCLVESYKPKINFREIASLLEKYRIEPDLQKRIITPIELGQELENNYLSDLEEEYEQKIDSKPSHQVSIIEAVRYLKKRNWVQFSQLPNQFQEIIRNKLHHSEEQTLALVRSDYSNLFYVPDLSSTPVSINQCFIQVQLIQLSERSSKINLSLICTGEGDRFPNNSFLQAKYGNVHETKRLDFSQDKTVAQASFSRIRSPLFEMSLVIDKISIFEQTIRFQNFIH